MIPDKPRMTQHEQRLPGIRCPKCGNFIPTSIQQILFSSCLFCPTCGFKLNIDKRKSDKALKILAKVDEAQKRAGSSNSIEPQEVVFTDEQLETINNALKDIIFED
jgi:DNA-directed RNA polymerase subunit RPC12/RpoP